MAEQTELVVLELALHSARVICCCRVSCWWWSILYTDPVLGVRWGQSVFQFYFYALPFTHPAVL